MALTGYGGSSETAIKKVGYGFDHEVLFSKEGYTPHYAEHIIDPLDGKEKLVMADPHTRFAAIIYDIKGQRIEWEYNFPDPDDTPGQVHNPHTARMLMADVAGFGSAGDIYCCSPQQKIVVIDRATKTIKTTKSLPWTPVFLHEACLSIDSEHLIVTDYEEDSYAKVKISDMSQVWKKTGEFEYPGKVSIIKGYDAIAHNPLKSGVPNSHHYLICSNAWEGTVHEISDVDGGIGWRSRLDGAGMQLDKPHTAFRMGRIECRSNITVVGCESGGGIYAVSEDKIPLWGFGVGGNRDSDTGENYLTTPMGTCEVTMVFPLMDGRVGFIDWGGVNRSNVCAINQLPQRQHVSMKLYHDRVTGNDFLVDKILPVGEWDEVYLFLQNVGDNNGTWQIIGSAATFGRYDWGDRWFGEKDPEVMAPGAKTRYKISQHWEHIKIEIKSTTPDQPAKFNCWVIWKRS